MKEKIQMKLFILGITLVLMSACAFGQQGFDTNLFKTKLQIKQLEKKSIILDLDITINNSSIKDTNYVLNVVNFNTGVLKTYNNVSNKIILYLEYSCEFEISISYKGTNTKSIIVNTDAPQNNWYLISGINLNTNNNNRLLVGGLRYNDSLQTFEKYKF